MRQTRTRTLSMLLVLMLLLTGCGGPSAAEGAEPSSIPKASAPVQETQGSQETPPPQEEAPAVAEINTWTSMQLINSDLIIAQGADGKFAILDRDGTVKTILSDCTSVDLVNQNCFVGFLDGTRTLYDLDGSVILTSQTGFKRAVPISSEDPWGIIMYEVAEKSDFGGKNTTHFMRMDTLEDVWQVDGDMSSVVGMLNYDGTQYVVKSRNQDTGAYTYLTLDGTELPDYQEADPLAARVEYGVFLEDLGYRKTELLGNGIGGLGRNKNDGTDIYNANHELCASYDSQIQLDSADSLGNFGLLRTYTSAAGYQTGVFDFQAGKFLLVVDGSTVNHSLTTREVHDAYSHLGEASAFLLENKAELHTLVCKNGTIIENVSLPGLFNSAAGYVLVTSTTEADKIMIINTETGEIVSEFQAHLTK